MPEPRGRALLPEQSRPKFTCSHPALPLGSSLSSRGPCDMSVVVYKICQTGISELKPHLYPHPQPSLPFLHSALYSG